MAAMNGKVLGKCGRNINSLKRKRESPAAYDADVFRTTELHQHPVNDSAVRFHVDQDRKAKIVCHFNKQVLQSYKNFMSSAPPKRILLRKGAVWKDVPENIVKLAQADFRAKKTITETGYQNHLFLLDFAHMTFIDTKTGLQRPIAWIDENGKSYFPESFIQDQKLFIKKDFGNGNSEYISVEPNGTREMNDQLGTSESSAESSNFDSSTEDVSSPKRARAEMNSIIKKYCDREKLLEKMSHALCCLQPTYYHTMLIWVKYHVLSALLKPWRSCCCRGWVLLLNPRTLLESTGLHYWMAVDRSVTIFTKSKCRLLDFIVEMQMSVMHGFLAPKALCMK